MTKYSEAAKGFVNLQESSVARIYSTDLDPEALDGYGKSHLSQTRFFGNTSEQKQKDSKKKLTKFISMWSGHNIR